MKILSAILIAVIAGFIVRYIIILLTLPLTGLMYLVIGPEDKEMKRPKLFWPIAIFNNTYNSYVMTAWAGTCIYFTKQFIASGGVDFPFIYYIIGFLACLGPIASMAAKEHGESFATNLAVTVAPISYVVFAIWPMGIYYLHWWWLGWVVDVFT